MVDDQKFNPAKSPLKWWIPEVGKVLGKCTGADLTRAIKILQARAAAQDAIARRLEQLAGLKVTEAAGTAKAAGAKLPPKA